MAYTKTVWENNSTPVLNADNLNKIEQGIENNSFESGSNSNGNYIKFNDGTMICYNTQTFSNITVDYVWGELYTNANDRRAFSDFPVSFVNTPDVIKSLNFSSGDGFLMTNSSQGETSSTNPGGWQFARGTAATGINLSVSYVAIGRWK